MGTARKKYSQQYKDEAVELVTSSSRSVAEVARDLGLNEGTVRKSRAHRLRFRSLPRCCTWRRSSAPTPRWPSSRGRRSEPLPRRETGTYPGNNVGKKPYLPLSYPENA